MRVLAADADDPIGVSVNIFAVRHSKLRRRSWRVRLVTYALPGENVADHGPYSDGWNVSPASRFLAETARVAARR